MKKGTEAIITGAEEHAFWTNWGKHRIDKHDISQKCRLCQTKDGSSMHIESGCKGLAKQQCKVRRDHCVVIEEKKKIIKYLEKALAEQHEKVEIITVIIEVMGSIPKQLENYINTLGIPDMTGGAQTSVLFGTGRILRNVLGL